jgi:serine/threonine protein kinase
VKEIDVGQIIGDKYVLVRLLGAGAMGQVWVSRHQALQHTFALKIMIPPSSSAQAYEGVETSLRRFRNEAQIAAALSRKSRHIAAVTDYGIDDGVAYLVMELLDGEGLDKQIGDGRRLHPAEVSHIVGQIAKGLAVAHEDGVTHRDLKPANVFLTKTEEGDVLVKLLDFGIARLAKRIVGPHDGRAPTRLTVKGLVLGSPAYMSPEQAMAESPDHRSDVWSLAVVAYEALAGVPPFFAKDADETILRICNFKSTPLRKVMPDASEELEALFKRAFSARMEDRFQSAASFAEALAALLPAPTPRFADTRPLAPSAAPAPIAVEGGDALKIPTRPRKVGLAIAAGALAGLLAAAALLVPRLISRPSAPAPPSATQSASVVVVAPPPPPVTSSPSTRAVIAVSATAAPPRATASATRIPATVIATPAPSKSVDRSAIF